MQNPNFQTNWKHRMAQQAGKTTPTPEVPQAEESTTKEDTQIALTGDIAAFYAQWISTHSKEEQAPIIQDPITKELLWISRKQRRTYKAKANRNTIFSALISNHTKALKKLTARKKSTVQKTSRRINRQAA